MDIFQQERAKFERENPSRDFDVETNNLVDAERGN